MASPPSSHKSNQLDIDSMAPPTDRSRGRDVHIYNTNDRTTVLGGLIVTEGITNANFYAMMEIIILFGSPFHLCNDEDTKIERDHKSLQPGNYYIVAEAPFHVNNDVPLFRTISLGTGARIKSFCDNVRSRDRRCVISGMPALGAEFGRWTGLEAGHIFPLAYEHHWNSKDFSRWITIPPEKESDGTINSVQNGILLRSDIHQLFDTYEVSINPDDNYKVVFFCQYACDFAGKCLDRQFQDDPRRPVDPLLKWHFRQAVLTNMKGSGEPIVEHDFPPGSDIVGNILHGQKAAERMEFELFGRLGAQINLYGASPNQK